MKHKNFVSMAALLILALSAVFLVTACPTGTGPSGSNNSGGAVTPPVVNAEETELTALLGKISLDKAIITTAPETITISNLPSAAGVTAEIVSDNTDLIKYEAPDKLKVKKLPETTTDVKITITLTKNSTSKSMDFTVKVFKSDATPTEEDYFDTLTIPTTVSDDFDLPKELQNGTPLAWSTENENIIKIDNLGINPKAIIEFDIVEHKVKLTATANGKSKVFEVTVLPVAKIEISQGPDTKKIYEFTQNRITIKEFRDNKLSHGILYSYTLDGATKKITVRPTSIFLPEGKWLSIEDYYNLIIDINLTYMKNYLESIDSLLSKPTISIADIKEAFKNFTHEDISEYTDKEIFEILLKKHLGMEYNEFIALSTEEQTNKIKAVLTGWKKQMAKQSGLPEDASTEAILAEFKKQLQQEAAQAKEPYTYTYSIRKDPGGNLHFETSVVYNPSKAWYENKGNWSYHPASPETSWISSISLMGPSSYSLSIEENQGGYTNSKHYSGTITGSGPDYTFNGSLQGNPEEKITATITDNLNGTIRIKVTEGGTAESTLSFRGHSL